MLQTQVLIQKALKARKSAYAPYSGFTVGAALLAGSEKIYTGSNIESAAYSPSNCAERTAFFTAVHAGEREFEAIAIVGGYRDKPLSICYPCGVCRQVMGEFCLPETFQIIVGVSETDYHVHSFKELFPYGFGPGNLSFK